MKTHANTLRIIALLAVALTAVTHIRAADGARITYQRVFKGSVPEFIEVTVSEEGPGTYDIRQLSDAPDPSPVVVSAEARAMIFQIAARQRNFDKVDFDTHKKLANIGQKSFRYSNGSVVHETKFNFTENKDGVELTNIFEGIAQRQQDWDRIESKLKYDRLGVNDALRQFEVDLDKGILTDPALVLPTLNKVIDDTRVIETARQRARSLAARLRPPAAPSPGQN